MPTATNVIDLTKAFDKVDHNILDKLYALGLSKYPLLWFNLYLHIGASVSVSMALRIHHYGKRGTSGFFPRAIAVFHFHQ